MSWYRTGTVTVTTGSKNVTGVGTLWASSVNVGDAFALVDANLNPTGAWYEVETVTSNTALVLKQTYTGTPAPGSNKQYAVFNLVGNMTTPSFAQRLAQFFDQFQNLVDLPTTTPTASAIPIAGSGGTLAAGWLPAASTSAAGAVELATSEEAIAGTDTGRAITPSVSGSRLTFATTSTDDATSATSAPLKSAGGLAVAKNAWVGGHVRYGSSAALVSLGPKVITGGSSVSTTALAMINGFVNSLAVTVSFRREGVPDYATGTCRRLIHVQGTTTESVGTLGTQENVGAASADVTIGWTNATRKLVISSVNTCTCYVTVHICGDNPQNITWEA